MDEFLRANAGTIITAGASLFAAFIGSYYILKARRTTPGAEPTAVKDIWEENRLTQNEIDRERRYRRRIEAWAYELIRVFRAYVGRVQAGGTTDLTAHERMFHDVDPPSGEVPITTPE